MTHALNPALSARSGPLRASGRASRGSVQPYHAAVPLDVEALRGRDPEMLDRLVRRHSAGLYGFILRLVHQPEEAQSLVQETFLQAISSLPGFRGHSKLSTWLYGIASNVTFAYLRKARRSQVLSEAEMERLQPRFNKGGQHVERFPSWNPEANLERQERIRTVHQALDRLPEKYRMVVVIRDLEERSTTEAAEILGISEANVRVRLHRARNALRSLLEPHFTPPAVPGTKRYAL